MALPYPNNEKSSRADVTPDPSGAAGEPRW
jgi:hypothetical protein